MTDTPAIRNRGQLASSSRMERAATGIGFCDQSQTKVTNESYKRTLQERPHVHEPRPGSHKKRSNLWFIGQKCLPLHKKIGGNPLLYLHNATFVTNL